MLVFGEDLSKKIDNLEVDLSNKIDRLEEKTGRLGWISASWTGRSIELLSACLDWAAVCCTPLSRVGDP